MTQGILLALLAATIYGFLGISFEIAAKRHYPVWDVIVYKQLTGFVIGLVFAIVKGLPLYEPRLIGLGLLGAVAYLVTLAAYLTASRERDIAANWTVVNLSVVVPILISIFWFKDAFTIMKALGVAFTLASIVLIWRRGRPENLGWQPAFAVDALHLDCLPLERRACDSVPVRAGELFGAIHSVFLRHQLPTDASV
jgi:drug/metabolite transporter (DMT)-like permease